VGDEHDLVADQLHQSGTSRSDGIVGLALEVLD